MWANTYRNLKIGVEQKVKIKCLRPLVPHEYLRFQAQLSQSDRIDQPEIVGPLLSQIHSQVFGSKAKVDLDGIFIPARFPEEFPFADPSETVLCEGGSWTFCCFAEYLFCISFLVC